MTTRARWVNQGTAGSVLIFYDSVTQETLDVMGAAVKFQDDFIGTAWTATGANLAGWTEKDTGAGNDPVDIVADQAGGVINMGLDATNEKQESGLYLGDDLNFDLDKGVIAEYRMTVTATPTGQAELYFGLANNYVEGPIAEADAGPTVHAFFCFDAALTPTIHTDDTTNDNNAVATGVTEVASTYSIFRIDCLDSADVKFYIDGSRVASSTTFDMSTGTNVVTQPFMMAHKETGTGVGTFSVDYVKVWQLTR